MGPLLRRFFYRFRILWKGYNPDEQARVDAQLQTVVEDAELKLLAERQRNEILSDNIKEFNQEHDKWHARLDEDNLKLRKANETLEADLSKLAEDNRQLQARVSDRDSKIFGLVPHRAEIIVDEARQQYGGLVQSVDEWVELWTEPILQNGRRQKQSIAFAKENPAVIHNLKAFMSQWPDLVAAVGTYDTDQDILAACILRYLQMSVFSSILCGVQWEPVGVIEALTQCMSDFAKPKPGLFAVRLWSATTYHALVAHPNINKHIELAIEHLSNHLAQALGFIATPSRADEFLQSILTMVVQPAVRLHVKFLTCTNRFAVHGDGRIHANSELDPKLSEEEVISLMSEMDYVDIAKNNRKFVLDKLKPVPTAAELRKYLLMVCSVRPALMVREIGRADELREPITVYKEKVLVAWVSDRAKLKGKDDIVPSSWLYRVLNG